MGDFTSLRRNTYLCLSLCFDYPSQTLTDGESTGIIAETFDSLAHIPGLVSLADKVREFNAALIANSESGEERLLDLQIEYSRLFLGPVEPQVYPNEGAFLSQSGRIAPNGFGLARLYSEEGLKLAPERKESPDHISIEFEFMAHLCGKELEALERGDTLSALSYMQRRRSFLEGHIANWVPCLSAVVERTAVVSFYKSLARITRGFVVWDYEQTEPLVASYERSDVCQ
jgi:TorA maturation chaperone TorD